MVSRRMVREVGITARRRRRDHPLVGQRHSERRVSQRPLSRNPRVRRVSACSDAAGSTACRAVHVYRPYLCQHAADAWRWLMRIATIAVWLLTLGGASLAPPAASAQDVT